MFKIFKFLFLFLISSSIFAQTNIGMKSWIDPWLITTVAIGSMDTINMPQSDGNLKRIIGFKIIGTGVFMDLPNKKSDNHFLVTAKHIFYNPSIKWEPESLRIRFSWFDDKPVDKYYGMKIILKRGNKKVWIAHPDTTVDLACIPLTLPTKETQKDIVHQISIDFFAQSEDFYEGASIAVLGYPGAVGPYYWTKSLPQTGYYCVVSTTTT